MKQNQKMQAEAPFATKVNELKLICSKDPVEFNKGCNDCLDDKRPGGPMFTFEPLGMYFIKEIDDGFESGKFEIFLWQVFVREETGMTLEPEYILPEKIKALHIVKSENVDEFNNELQFCIDNNYLLADPVRVNRPPDSNQLIFTAMFIKTEKQMIIQPSTMTQIN